MFTWISQSLPRHPLSPRLAFVLLATNFDAGSSLVWTENGAFDTGFSKELFVIETFSRHLSESFSILEVVERGLPWWSSGKESACQCRRHGFDPWERFHVPQRRFHVLQGN